MIEGNDGGANVSIRRRQNWTEQDQATAQFYRVTSTTIFRTTFTARSRIIRRQRIASRTADFAITERDWYDVGGGESGWIAPHPENSDIVFAGSYGGYLTRYDHRTKQLATSTFIRTIRWARARKR
jgi:hypothetical protein